MAKNKSKINPSGMGCLAIFGLPFFLVGFSVFIYGLSMFYTWHQAANWPRVPAKIHSAKIEKHSDSDGDTTYSIKGSYSYSYQGKDYKGDRIEIESGSSSAYGEKKRMLNQMKKAMKNKSSIDAMVNPQNPGDSILFRHVSQGMYLFSGIGFIFSLVGGFLIFLGITGSIKERKKAKALALNPDQPWKAEDRWDGFSIKTNQLKAVLSAWALGIFVTIFISIFLITLYTDSGAPIFAWVIIGIFTLVALALDINAVYQTIKFIKFGESRLVLKQMPIVPGREFKGLVILPANMGRSANYDFELRCEKRLTTRSGKNSTTTTTVLFKEKVAITSDPRNTIRERQFLPFSFIVPEGCETDSPSTNPVFEWKLKVENESSGVDYSAEFSLPVFEVSSESLIEFKD